MEQTLQTFAVGLVKDKLAKLRLHTYETVYSLDTVEINFYTDRRFNVLKTEQSIRNLLDRLNVGATIEPIESELEDDAFYCLTLYFD